MDQDTIQNVVQWIGMAIAVIVIAGGAYQLVRRKTGSRPMAGNSRKDGMREE